VTDKGDASTHRPRGQWEGVRTYVQWQRRWRQGVSQLGLGLNILQAWAFKSQAQAAALSLSWVCTLLRVMLWWLVPNTVSSSFPLSPNPLLLYFDLKMRNYPSPILRLDCKFYWRRITHSQSHVWFIIFIQNMFLRYRSQLQLVKLWTLSLSNFQEPLIYIVDR